MLLLAAAAAYHASTTDTINIIIKLNNYIGIFFFEL